MEPWGSAVCFFLLLFGVFAAMCCRGVLSGKIRSCLNDERQFLLLFRDASPTCSWDLWRNCCEWKGVECHRRQYHVIKLDLHSSDPGSVQRICNWKSPLNPKGVWGAGVLGLKHLKRLDAIPAGGFNGYLLQNMRDCYYRDQIRMITKRCVLMTCIDLSGNQLTGDIPSQIGSLKCLRCLNISRNHITGQIYEYGAIGVRVLSNNELCAKISTQMVSLNFLEVFIVANNRLLGRALEGFSVFNIRCPFICKKPRPMWPSTVHHPVLLLAFQVFDKEEERLGTVWHWYLRLLVVLWKGFRILLSNRR